MAPLLASASLSAEEPGYPEKEELTFGFIKLTDMVPIAIAYEKGYFEDEGLYVTIEAQANWKVLLDGVIDGRPVHPIKADSLKPVVKKYKEHGKPFNMGMVFPVSTHN